LLRLVLQALDLVSIAALKLLQYQQVSLVQKIDHYVVDDDQDSQNRNESVVSFVAVRSSV
jgi:hypothetical protein